MVIWTNLLTTFIMDLIELEEIERKIQTASSDADSKYNFIRFGSI